MLAAASTAAFCRKDPLHDPRSHERGGECRNQDGRIDSFLVCLTGVTGSTWAQREACTRFEQSDVGKPQEICFSETLGRTQEGERRASCVA